MPLQHAIDAGDAAPNLRIAKVEADKRLELPASRNPWWTRSIMASSGSFRLAANEVISATRIDERFQSGRKSKSCFFH